MNVAGRRRVALGAVVVAVLLVAALVALLLGVFDGDGLSADEKAAARRRKEAAVTEANNGGEVGVTVNKPFILDLKGSPDAPWGLPEATSEALARVSTSLDANGSSAATFNPLEVTPGVTITAERVPTCRAATPACDLPTEHFEVTIRVTG